MNRPGRLIHLVGAVWIVAGLALVLIGFVARAWIDVDALTAAWPIDVAAVTRFEFSYARFLLLLPGFLLAFIGYRMQRQPERSPGPDGHAVRR